MFIPVKKTRKQLLWLWIGVTIPIILLVLLQTISGKLADIEGIAWLWVGINLFPTLLFLMIGGIQNKNADKVIHRPISRAIWLFTLLYLVILLLTQFGLVGGTGDQSIGEYLQQSYQWLLPFQIIIFAVLSILFFQKQLFFQPKKTTMLNYLEKQAQLAEKNNNQVKKETLLLLKQDKFAALFDQLNKAADAKEHGDNQSSDIFLVTSRYNKWKKNTDLGLMDSRDLQTEWNQIIYALSNLINELYPKK